MRAIQQALWDILDQLPNDQTVIEVLETAAKANVLTADEAKDFAHRLGVRLESE